MEEIEMSEYEVDRVVERDGEKFDVARSKGNTRNVTVTDENGEVAYVDIKSNENGGHYYLASYPHPPHSAAKKSIKEAVDYAIELILNRRNAKTFDEVYQEMSDYVAGGSDSEEGS